MLTKQHKIYHYPDSSKVNDRLTKFIKKHCYSYDDPHKTDDTVPANGTVRYASTDNNPMRSVKGVGPLLDWIQDQLLDAAADFNNASSGNAPFDIAAFSIYEYWGMYYPEGSETLIHDHFPNAMTFAYYTCCPDGSSPLIVEDNEVEVEEGMLVVFPASYVHYVPITHVEGRTMISGNVVYQPNQLPVDRNKLLPENLRKENYLTEDDVPVHIRKEVEHMWQSLKQEGVIDTGEDPSDHEEMYSFGDWKS